jgi:hypothetical protein
MCRPVPAARFSAAVVSLFNPSALISALTSDGSLLPLAFLDPETLALNDRPAVCDDSAIAHLPDACRQLVALSARVGQ